jgi:hypothetical protein
VANSRASGLLLRLRGAPRRPQKRMGVYRGVERAHRKWRVVRSIKSSVSRRANAQNAMITIAAIIAPKHAGL